MSETFYSELEVGQDADSEAIRRAYRTQVKDTHPDVSDDPGAAESFKRLTTARDVLLDDVERQRYDRLGHDTYVSEHASESIWDETVVAPTTASGSSHARESSRTSSKGRSQSSSSSWYSSTTTGTTGSGGVTGSGRSASSSSSTGKANRSGSTARAAAGEQSSTSYSRTDGGYTRPSWQRSSGVYQRAAMNGETGQGSHLGNTLAGLRELGAWFIIHVVLILSTLATAWFILIAAPGVTVSPAVIVAVGLLVPMVIALSGLHILVTLHS